MQLQYWNGRLRRPAGLFFSGSTTLELERPSLAAGWISFSRFSSSTTFVQERPWPAGFSFSGSTTLVLERPSPAAAWISLLCWCNFSTGLQRLRRERFSSEFKSGHQDGRCCFSVFPSLCRFGHSMTTLDIAPTNRVSTVAQKAIERERGRARASGREKDR